MPLDLRFPRWQLLRSKKLANRSQLQPVLSGILLPLSFCGGRLVGVRAWGRTLPTRPPLASGAHLKEPSTASYRGARLGEGDAAERCAGAALALGCLPCAANCRCTPCNRSAPWGSARSCWPGCLSIAGGSLGPYQAYRPTRFSKETLNEDHHPVTLHALDANGAGAANIVSPLVR